MAIMPIKAARNLPDDIVCEILAQSKTMRWSFRQSALLCRINKAEWLEVSKFRVLCLCSS